MNKKIIIFIGLMVLMSAFAFALTPQDGFNYRGIYGISNASSLNTTTICLLGDSCRTTWPVSIDTKWNIDNYTLINDSNVLKVDMSYMNDTMDARDSDTTYSAGDYLYLSGTEFNVNQTDLNNTIDARNTDTTYSNGTGLLLNGSNFFSLDTSYTDGLYINVDGDNMSGTFTYTDSLLRLDNETNLFFYDTTGEAKHLNSFAESYDKLRANTFTSQLTMYTFHNATGDYISINTTDSKIRFITNVGQDAESSEFDYSSIYLPLTAGTNTTPILNRVYAYLNAGVPTWAVTTSDPTVTHAMAARILVGDDANTVYAAGLQEDGSNGFLKRTQRRFRKEGLLYEEGLDYDLLVDNVYIGNGTFINGIYDQSTVGVNMSTEGFYIVHTDGTYHWYNDISEITEYSDGNTIGSNKYYNIVFGTTPYDGHANIYAIVQSEPPTEYTSVTIAYADNGNTLKVLPSEDFLKLNFLPVVRVIVNSQSDELQILPSGALGEDYRGGIAGGVSSGGGISEADPLSIHFDGSVELTGNWDAGNFNITANTFNGDWNGSSLYYTQTEIDASQLVQNNTLINNYYTRIAIDASQLVQNNTLINNYYNKTFIDLNYYTQAMIDASQLVQNNTLINNYYTRTAIDASQLVQNNTLATNYYTKTEIDDSQFVQNSTLESNYYTQAVIDASQLVQNNTLANNYYDKTAIDASQLVQNNTLINNYYTRTAIDASQLVQNNTLANNYYDKTAIDASQLVQNNTLANNYYDKTVIDASQLVQNNTLANNYYTQSVIDASQLVQNNTLSTNYYDKTAIDASQLVQNNTLINNYYDKTAIDASQLVQNNTLANNYYTKTLIDASQLVQNNTLVNNYYTKTLIDASQLVQNNTIGTKAGTGTCAEGYFVQNITTGSPQCALPTGSSYSAGNGISLTGTTFSVAAGTALTQDASGLSVTNDAIGDTQLTFNTGQHLTTTSDVQFGEIAGSGDVTASTNGATTTTPRVLAFSDLSSGEAGRFQFGDSHNALQNAYGNDVQMYSYWGITLAGGMQNYNSGFLPLPFAKHTDVGVLILSTNDIGDDPGAGATNIVTLGVQAVAGQTNNLTEWRASDGTKLASVSATGNIVAPYFYGDGSGLTGITGTTYTAGNGISLTGTNFSVAAGTALTQDAGGLSVTADAIGDTQLTYNTGQHLTTTSNPTFNNATITDCITFTSGGKICDSP